MRQYKQPADLNTKRLYRLTLLLLYCSIAPKDKCRVLTCVLELREKGRKWFLLCAIVPMAEIIYQALHRFGPQLT